MNGKEFIKELLKKLFEDYENNKFSPILEADIVGYLYHLCISKIGDAKNIHLDTRICELADKKFDFVLGEVSNHGYRPCVKPKLVIEVKSFPIGCSDQQHRVHYYHVIDDDIPKIAKLKEPLNNRYILLFDEDNYLKGFDRKSKSARIDRIIKTRNDTDPKIKVIYVKKGG
ncbi:MAG: hypothetical protein QXF82_03460 [Nitrososphaeria archaeon]